MHTYCFWCSFGGGRRILDLYHTLRPLPDQNRDQMCWHFDWIVCLRVASFIHSTRQMLESGHESKTSLGVFEEPIFWWRLYLDAGEAHIHGEPENSFHSICKLGLVSVLSFMSEAKRCLWRGQRPPSSGFCSLLPFTSQLGSKTIGLFLQTCSEWAIPMFLYPSTTISWPPGTPD